MSSKLSDNMEPDEMESTNFSLRGSISRAWTSRRRRETAAEDIESKGRFVSSQRLVSEEIVLDIGSMANFEEADAEERDDNAGVLSPVSQEDQEVSGGADVDDVEQLSVSEQKPEIPVRADDVEEAELPKLTEGRGKAGNQAVGSHLLTSNIFYLEVAPNHVIRRALYAVHAVFFASIIFEVLSVYGNRSEFRPSAIVPVNDTSGPLCLLLPNGTCTAYDTVNSSEAVLLANTGVVSTGINVSDWKGYGAIQGTPPFTSHQIDSGVFLADHSILDYGANPQLHPVWDDIVAMAWFGYQKGRDARDEFHVVYVDLEFFAEQDWPASVADEPFSVRLEGYGCLRGEDCDNIGNWRVMVIDNENIRSPKRQVSGRSFKARVVVYVYLLGEEVIDSLAWRIALLGDPGGAVSTALLANNTDSVILTSLVISGEAKYPIADSIVTTIVLAAYIVFVLWWFYSIYKICGRCKEWATENKWLIVSSVGFILSVNPIIVGLQFRRQRNEDAALAEGAWVAAFVVGAFGQALLYFVFGVFSDAPRRFVVSKWSFYGWKSVFSICLFVTYALAHVYRFPSISGWDEPGTASELGGQGYVTAPEDWIRRDQVIISVFLTLLLALNVFAFGYYVWANRRSQRVLNYLPYALSRPIQLSSRFFFWVTGLWVLVEFIMIIVNVIDVIVDERIYYAHLDTLGKYVSSLDRMYFLNGGFTSFYQKVFGLVFFVTFQLFFLPPESLGRSSEKAKTHYVSEEEAEKDGDSVESLMILELTRLLMVCSKEVYLPFEIDCESPDVKAKEKPGVEKKPVTAVISRNGSSEGRDQSFEEVSRDTSEITNQEFLGKDIETTPTNSSAQENKSKDIDSSSQGTQDQERETRFAGGSGSAPGYLPWESTLEMGCTVVAHVAEPEGTDMHNTRAIILRHTETNDLIIAFRGTLTKKQVQTDVMSSKVLVDLDTFLTTSAPERCGTWKTRTANIEYISPDVVEAKIRRGEIKKIRLVDLLPKHGKGGVPDYLESATKRSDEIEGAGQIHFGFWSSYNRVRRQVHTIVREELLASPGRLLITGHSLGGAQATLCAYDMCRYVLPTVRNQLEESNRKESIKIACYTYGSPRVGCGAFRAAYNKMMPNTQRVVNDGDVVTAMPPLRMGFRHVGRENIFDRVGSVRVKPSLIERKFLRSKNEVTPHKMDSYRDVIVKSFDPVTDETQLLDTIRKGYYG